MIRIQLCLRLLLVAVLHLVVEFADHYMDRVPSGQSRGWDYCGNTHKGLILDSSPRSLMDHVISIFPIAGNTSDSDNHRFLCQLSILFQ